MKIGEVLNGVYDKSVGWRPASGAIKPVHIANGLFRDLLGTRYDIKNVISFTVPWKKKNNPDLDPNRTYEYLFAKTADPRFKAFCAPGQKDRFERLREFARGLLGADRALFPQPDITSLTLTCRQMISADRNDRDVGRCMGSILRGQGSEGKLGKLVVERLSAGSEQPDDPISLLCWPLLSQEAVYLPGGSQRASPHENKQCKDFFQHLEKAAGDLADHERLHGNRLATLQRAVHFACLAVLAHAQALAAHGRLQERAPLLLVLDAPKGSRLATASEHSLDNYYQAFENWLTEKLADRLVKGQPIVFASGDNDKDMFLELPPQRKDSIRKFLKEILADGGDELTVQEMDDRMNLYELAVAKHGKENWSTVVAETVVQCYLSEYLSGGPRQFLAGIGRKVGLIYPHFQGRSKEKRVSPSVVILEALVKACTPAAGPIPFNAFATNLWERFGFVVGGHVGEKGNDVELLQQSGIEVGPTDLDDNCRVLIDRLAEIGLARRYPDNISYIGSYRV